MGVISLLLGLSLYSQQFDTYFTCQTENLYFEGMIVDMTIKQAKIKIDDIEYPISGIQQYVEKKGDQFHIYLWLLEKDVRYELVGDVVELGKQDIPINFPSLPHYYFANPSWISVGILYDRTPQHNYLFPMACVGSIINKRLNREIDDHKFVYPQNPALFIPY